MDLSCDRCLARFSTSEEPIPGRTYRVPCQCGNTMVVEIDASGGDPRLIASAEFELATAQRDDPFARALRPGGGRIEVTGPISARLAERDPDAPLDDSAEVHVTGAVSFDDLLRQARMKGFLAGSAAGALGAAAIAVALSLATSRPVATMTIQTIEPRAELSAPAPRTPDTAAAAVHPAAPSRRASEVAEPPRRAPERPPPTQDAPLPEAPVAAAEVPPPAETRVGLDLAAPPSPAAARSEPPAPEPSAAASPAAPAASPTAPAASPPAASKAKGPFPEREVAEALKARRAELADCVAATPGPAAGRGQRFALTVVIDPSGRVSDVQIDDPEIETTPLGVCLLRLVHAMSFAPFEGQPFRVELALGYGDAE